MNSVFIFISFISLIIFFLIYAVNNYFPKSVENKIEVIARQNSLKINENVKLSNNIKIIKDYYIFEILNSKVINDNSYKIRQNNNELKSYSGFDGDVPPAYNSGLRDQTVNLLFVSNKTNEKTILFNNNILLADIYYYNLDNINSTYKVSKNIYEIISEDTNNDKFMDALDRKDLYVSDYNGKKLSLILKNILNYNVVADNLILIKIIERNNMKFYIYNLIDNNLKEILNSNEIEYKK